MVPCVIFEDEHLLVVNKPAGWNTHAPSPHAGEGIYDWLRHRDPRWSSLAIIHRLDKETSGVLVFGKSPVANRSLTKQFTEHRIRKRYRLLTDRHVAQPSWDVRNRLVRCGSHYTGAPEGQGGDPAETRFTTAPRCGEWVTLIAEPQTGRTHQIRVHAAESGVPILGDTLYGGSGFPRLCLHAEAITLTHPESGRQCEFTVEMDFKADARQALRNSFIEPGETDACRLVQGASDGWPGWYVDRLGDYLLSQSEEALDPERMEVLADLRKNRSAKGVYHKRLTRHVRQTTPEDTSPQLVMGDPAPNRFLARENGLQFELSFTEGYSVGLFLDQRDNRRRLLTGHVAARFLPLADATPEPREILNTFAYTCAFSVCGARGGARVTSLDLSRKYLDWGRRNFELNGLDPAEHDFIYGDAFDWMKRLAKKRRRFDMVILDPPTFSQSKQSGVFRAAKDYGKLVTAAVALLRPGGVLLASTNAAGWDSGEFLATLHSTLTAQSRRVSGEHYCPQPPDFPISRGEPAYLKTAWLRID